MESMKMKTEEKKPDAQEKTESALWREKAPC